MPKPITIEIDLEKDEKFVSQLKTLIASKVADLLDKNDQLTMDVLAHAISRYFEYKRGSIEAFVKEMMIKFIIEAFDDQSSLEPKDKLKGIIANLLREAIASVVKDHIKNVTIDMTGLNDESQ